jgi:hypothetical protein
MTTKNEFDTKTNGATGSTSGSTSGSASDEAGSRSAAVGGAVSDAADTVREAAVNAREVAAAKLPEVAATTRSAIEDANRQMQSGSDEMLAMGTALTFGLAIGMLVGGAPRIFVAGALVPAAAMVITLFTRAGWNRPAKPRSMQGA